MKHKCMLAILIIAMIFVAGCITAPITAPSGGGDMHKIHWLSTGNMLLLRDEVVKINYSEVEPKSRLLGYESRNESENTTGEANIQYGFSKMENNTQYFALVIYIYDIINSSSGYPAQGSYIGGRYNTESPFPESNLTEKKQWLEDRVNEIATICNLTVNWSQVQWSITYAD